MKNVILFLSVIFSSNSFASQLQAYMFDNYQGGIMHPNQMVEQVRLGDQDGGGNLTLTVNCGADKNEIIIEKSESVAGYKDKTTLFARADYESPANCQATSKLIWDTAGNLKGVVKVRVDPETNKIFDAVIFKAAAEMHF